MKIFTYGFFFWALSFFSTIEAQDIHFSMFYASPITLNPALTGATDGTYRAAVIFRNQWRSVTTPAPYNTYAASFDMKVLEDKLKNDIFGVGVLLEGDRSTDGALTMNDLMVSAAYHKSLDKNHRHYLGLGVQLAYSEMALNVNELTFPSEFNSMSNQFDLPSSVSIQKPMLNYFDMNMGLLYQGEINDRIGIMAGGAIYHLVEPLQSFTGENTRLADRFVVHAGLRIKVVKNFYINPNFIYQYQNEAQEINFGAAFEYHITTDKSELVMSLGGWYRVNDAPILSTGFEYYKLRLMFAYDINTSALKPATTDRGAFELAILFTGVIKTKSINNPILVPCPMM